MRHICKGFGLSQRYIIHPLAVLQSLTEALFQSINLLLSADIFDQQDTPTTCPPPRTPVRHGSLQTLRLLATFTRKKAPPGDFLMEDVQSTSRPKGERDQVAESELWQVRRAQVGAPLTSYSIRHSIGTIRQVQG